MKVAIVHDVYVEEGGAERVLISLLKLYPHADVYIPLLSAEHVPKLSQLTSGQVITSAFNKIPFSHSASLLLKPLLYWYWEGLDLTAYALVISSSHSFSSKSVLTSPETLHVSYIHTSPRYLYTEFNETRIIKHPVFKVLLSPFLNWLRVRDFIGGHRPDILVANSQVVQKRIAKYYRRSSTLIHPPIIMPAATTVQRRPSPKLRKAGFYICVSRLAKQKGLELAIQACNQDKLPLVVVGTGAEAERLRALAGPTVSFAGRVSDAELTKLYSQARALLYCSIEEDFGMVPVEAMAHGVPVVGYRSGGTAETIVHGRTGVLFEAFTVESLSAAIKFFETQNRAGKITARRCRARAEQYSETVFRRKIRATVTKGLKKIQSNYLPI